MDRSLEDKDQGFSEKKMNSDFYLSIHFYFERNSPMVMKFLDHFSVDI